MTFLYEKSFEYHQSITKMDEMRRNEEESPNISTERLRLYRFYTISTVVVSRDGGDDGGFQI